MTLTIDPPPTFEPGTLIITDNAFEEGRVYLITSCDAHWVQTCRFVGFIMKRSVEACFISTVASFTFERMERGDELLVVQ